MLDRGFDGNTDFKVLDDTFGQWAVRGPHQVTIDAVSGKMIGFDPMSLGYFNVAHQDGLGVCDPRNIEIVGNDISGKSWGFKVGDNLASMGGRQRDVPRPLPLVDDGQEDLRDLETRHHLESPVLAVRGRPADHILRGAP